MYTQLHMEAWKKHREADVGVGVGDYSRSFHSTQGYHLVMQPIWVGLCAQVYSEIFCKLVNSAAKEHI